MFLLILKPQEYPALQGGDELRSDKFGEMEINGGVKMENFIEMMVQLNKK